MPEIKIELTDSFIGQPEGEKIEELLRAIANEDTKLTINIACVDGFSSYGIGALLGFGMSFESITLINANDKIKNVFALLGLDLILHLK